LDSPAARAAFPLEILIAINEMIAAVMLPATACSMCTANIDPHVMNSSAARKNG